MNLSTKKTYTKKTSIYFSHHNVYKVFARCLVTWQDRATAQYQRTNMSIIGFLYSTVGILVLFGYMPQIRRLWKSKTDCREISITSWMIWNYTAIVSLLYSVFDLADVKFSLVNGINVICINIIILLTLYKRSAYKKRRSQSQNL